MLDLAKKCNPSSWIHPSGCDSFMHVPKEKISKLDIKSEKCLFIGYKNGVKGYKFWNLVKRKTIYSRDVIFREVEDASKIEDVKRNKKR